MVKLPNHSCTIPAKTHTAEYRQTFNSLTGKLSMNKGVLCLVFICEVDEPLVQPSMEEQKLCTLLENCQWYDAALKN